jgi:hypothetical protein
MAGRPKVRADLAKLTTLTVGDADMIFERIGSGEMLYRIAATLGVGRTALAEWLDASPERQTRLKRARERSASALAEQTIEIADNGATVTAPGDPQESDPARDKLRIQTRQWLASRWDRETYGEQKGPQVTINLATLHLDALRQQKAPAARVIEAPAESAATPEMLESGE